MQNHQIMDVVRRLPELQRIFRGVYASDTLPVHVGRFPSAYVSNTDPINDEGSHWVAFWFQSPTESEFYDSFGKLPEDYSTQLREFIDRNALTCLYNNIQVQPRFTSTCGYHVLFYLYYRAKGYSMKNILNKLDEMISDEHVRDFIVGTYLK